MTRGQKGQTLAEFALIVPALLMAIFAIIEGGRIFQAYVTVQGASREAARYAITGNAEPGKGRVQSIEDVVWAGTRGLRIVPGADFDDPYQMIISVFAYDENLGVVREGYAGAPGEKVTVRVTYNIGLLTPFLSQIASAIRLSGESEMVNEAFGEFGSRQLGVVPATMPALPTVGASPTPSETPTPTETPLPTSTPTETSTPTPCPPDIIEPLIMSNTIVSVDGEPGVSVEVWDLNDNILLGSDTFAGSNYCEGWVDVAVPLADYPDGLVVGHQIGALSAWGNDSARVQGETPTPTPTSTGTPTPTSTPSPTPTPSTPYIAIEPVCMESPGAVIIKVRGENWPTAASRDIQITWNGSIVLTFSSRASWEVDFVRDESQTQEGTYTVEAFMVDDPGIVDSKEFTVPCLPDPTATPTPTWSPVEVLVNCGASDPYEDTLGQTWQADQVYSEGSWGYYGPANPRYEAEEVAGTEDDPLYQYYTFRDGLTYIFDVPPSVYDITLKFAEPKWDLNGKRVFDVLLEGNVVVDDLDIYAAAPGKWVAHDRSVSVQVSDGHLDLNFVNAGSPDYPVVSAIGINAVAPTPTPTPIPPPDLIVPWERLAISPSGDLSSCQPITITVVVKNQSGDDVSSFFWVDVYTSTVPITPTYLTPGVDWKGVSSLGSGDSITLTLRYDHGFPATGTYYIYGLADSWTQVEETNEQNNFNLQDIVVDVVSEGICPPTPTPLTGDGAISGFTWVYFPPMVQHGRVDVQCYNSSNQLVAETTSNDGAYFRIEGLADDWYTLVAYTTIDSVQYQATRLVEVTGGMETSNVFLVLMPV